MSEARFQAIESWFMEHPTSTSVECSRAFGMKSATSAGGVRFVLESKGAIPKVRGRAAGNTGKVKVIVYDDDFSRRSDVKKAQEIGRKIPGTWGLVLHALTAWESLMQEVEDGHLVELVRQPTPFGSKPELLRKYTEGRLLPESAQRVLQETINMLEEAEHAYVSSRNNHR